MGEIDHERLANLCAHIAEQRLPRWNALPDLELYMDQVLSLMERYLGNYPGFDRKGLTAAMVNNYVKLGVMPPPVKKKYTDLSGHRGAHRGGYLHRGRRPRPRRQIHVHQAVHGDAGDPQHRQRLPPRAGEG